MNSKNQPYYPFGTVKFVGNLQALGKPTWRTVPGINEYVFEPTKRTAIVVDRDDRDFFENHKGVDYKGKRVKIYDYTPPIDPASYEAEQYIEMEEIDQSSKSVLRRVEHQMKPAEVEQVNVEELEEQPNPPTVKPRGRRNKSEE